MVFKVLSVLCATLAFAQAGLLAAPAVAYSPANEVSHVYSSIGAVAHQPIVAQAGPILAAPAVARIAAPVVAHAAPVYQAPVVSAVRSYAAPAPVYPIAKQLAYSPAHEVSQVYSSIAAPQLAYGGHAPLAISAPAVGSTHQSTVRSLGGTISTYSKAVDTAFSSVRKADTRISNNVFTPALATKTVAIQQPAYVEQKTIPATVVSHVTFDGLGAHYNW